MSVSVSFDARNTLFACLGFTAAVVTAAVVVRRFSVSKVVVAEGIREKKQKKSRKWSSIVGKPGGDGFVTTLMRVMLPDDANPAGNVHGGTILKMMEQSAFIVCSRHASAYDSDAKVNTSVVLVQIKDCSFLAAMHIGDVAHVQCSIIATHSSSMEVSVRVFRENTKTKELQLTNVAMLWYVHVEKKMGSLRSKPLLVRIESSDKQAEQRYLSLKTARAQQTITSNIFDPNRDPTELVMARLMLPSDATVDGMVFGGVLAKMMDSGAGVTAFRHCRSNVVTICLEDFVLLCAVKCGDHVSVFTRVVFTSNKTMEMEVVATVNVPIFSSSSKESHICCRARFTFVALDGSGKVGVMPSWSPTTEREKEVQAIAAARYEKKKQLREEAKKRAVSK